MAVAFDAAAWAPATGSVTSFNMRNVSVGNNPNRLLIAYVIAFTAITSPTATWDSGGTNQAMTLVNSQANVGSTMTVYMFRLANPTPGNKTLAFSWTTASSNIGFVTSSWFNVNVLNPMPQNVPGNGTTASPTQSVFNVPVGDVATCLLQTATHPMLTANNNVAVWQPSFGAALNYAGGAGGTVTLSGTTSASDNWVATASQIAAAKFATAGTPVVMM